MATILGIDEAGRGAVIGPLVLAGVMIDEKDEQKLRDIGVKDSKMLKPEQRERMFEQIKAVAKDYAIVKISAKEIDEGRVIKNLNRLEAEKMGEIIRILKADRAYVDAPQVSTDKFKQYLLALAKNHTEIIAENYADKTYPVCSAASILAKVERDREIEELKKEVGYDFGVGYSHDERTINFLRHLLDKHKGEFPDFVRKSWITAIDIKEKRAQKKLAEFKVKEVEDD